MQLVTVLNQKVQSRLHILLFCHLLDGQNCCSILYCRVQL